MKSKNRNGKAISKAQGSTEELIYSRMVIALLAQSHRSLLVSCLAGKGPVVFRRDFVVPLRCIEVLQQLKRRFLNHEQRPPVFCTGGQQCAFL